MDYVLMAPFGFAITVAALLFAYLWRFAAITVRSDVPIRRDEPSSR
jgi:hypothetical protein